MSKMLRNVLSESKYIIEKDVSQEAKAKNPNILGAFTAVISKMDQKTQNGTYYSEELWDAVLEDDKFKDKMKKKLILGEIDHPEQPDSSIKRVSHAITDMWKEGKDLKGRCEVFNTPNGQILWTLLNAGVILGMSTRALGDEEFTEGMRKIKKEGFDFISADMVIDASAIGAGFKEMSESKKRYMTESLSKVKDPITEEIMKTIEQGEVEEKLNVLKVENTNLKSLLETHTSGTKTLKEQIDRLTGEKMKVEAQKKEWESKFQEQKDLVETKNKAMLQTEQKIQEVTDRNTLLEKEITEKATLLGKAKAELEEAKKQLTKKQIKYEVKITPDSALKAKVDENSVISRNIKKSVGRQ